MIVKNFLTGPSRRGRFWRRRIQYWFKEREPWTERALFFSETYRDEFERDTENIPVYRASVFTDEERMSVVDPDVHVSYSGPVSIWDADWETFFRENREAERVVLLFDLSLTLSEYQRRLVPLLKGREMDGHRLPDNCILAVTAEKAERLDPAITRYIFLVTP